MWIRVGTPSQCGWPATTRVFGQDLPDVDQRDHPAVPTAAALLGAAQSVTALPSLIVEQLARDCPGIAANELAGPGRLNPRTRRRQFAFGAV